MIDRARSSSFTESFHAQASMKSKPNGVASKDVKAVSTTCQPRLLRCRSVPERFDIRYSGRPLFWFRAKVFQRGGCSTRGICQVGSQEAPTTVDADSDSTKENRVLPFKLVKSWESIDQVKTESTAVLSSSNFGSCTRRILVTRQSQLQTEGDSFHSMIVSDESLRGLAFLEEETD